MPERQLPLVQRHQLRQQTTEGHRILAAGDRQQQSASAGQQIRLLQQAGLEIALLSGGQGGATEVRARQLGIRHCLVGIKDKPAALTALQAELGVTATGTAFVGDDLNDLAVRPVVGLLLAPADACQAVRLRADAILNQPGGHGAVRELAERLLQARGGWEMLSRKGCRDRND